MNSKTDNIMVKLVQEKQAKAHMDDSWSSIFMWLIWVINYNNFLTHI